MGFQQMVTEAVAAAAASIYNEATVLTGSVKAGTANATFGITPALAVAITAGTLVHVGTELVVCAAGAAQNATSIVTTTTTAIDHLQGEPVSPPAVVNHAARASYARQVLNSLQQYMVTWAEALAAQGLDKTSLDTAISNGVASLWNAMAGA